MSEFSNRDGQKVNEIRDRWGNDDIWSVQLLEVVIGRAVFYRSESSLRFKTFWDCSRLPKPRVWNESLAGREAVSAHFLKREKLTSQVCDYEWLMLAAGDVCCSGGGGVPVRAEDARVTSCRCSRLPGRRSHRVRICSTAACTLLHTLVRLRYIENIKIPIRYRCIVSPAEISKFSDIPVSTCWYIILPNFHVWCQEVVKFSLKLSPKLSLLQWKFRWKFQLKFHDFLTPHVKIRQENHWIFHWENFENFYITTYLSEFLKQ